jgi:hypothetical protein
MVQNTSIPHFPTGDVRSKKFDRFRPKFVGWAIFPLGSLPPAEATLSDLPAYRQAGRQAGWTISSFSSISFFNQCLLYHIYLISRVFVEQVYMYKVFE